MSLRVCCVLGRVGSASGGEESTHHVSFCVPPLHFERCHQLLTSRCLLSCCCCRLPSPVVVPAPSMPSVASPPSNSPPPVEFNAPPSSGVDFYTNGTSVAPSTPKLNNKTIPSASAITDDDTTSIALAAARRLPKLRRRTLKCGGFPPRRVFL